MSILHERVDCFHCKKHEAVQFFVTLGRNSEWKIPVARCPECSIKLEHRTDLKEISKEDFLMARMMMS